MSLKISRGCTVGRKYVVIKEIGSGNFARVYSAYDVARECLVAIKLVGTKNSDLSSIRSEIEINKLANKINSFGTIIFLDEFSYNGEWHCLVLELMEFSLNQLVKSLPQKFLSLEKVREIGKQMFHILESLARSDAGCLIHADIKPENVFIEPENWSVKLGDFGISAYGAGQTNTVGTLQYMAPEVLFGLSYDSSVDTWGAACTMFELFSGRQLFNRGFLPDIVSLLIETCGMPPEEFIEVSPEIHRYFYKLHERWFTSDKSIRPFTKSLRKQLTLYRDAQEEAYETLEESVFNSFVDLLNMTLKWMPSHRLTPTEALKHSFFNDFNANQK